MHQLMRITPSNVRFIRLGPGNRWADACFDNNHIVLSHKEVPHELAVTGDWAKVKSSLENDVGHSLSVATSALREIKEFYTLGPDCLWVTFVDGKLWWAFAEPEVVPLPGDAERDGARYRRVIGRWRSTDIFGRSLLTDQLSTELTKTRMHRRTICRVGHQDYAIGMINGMVT